MEQKENRKNHEKNLLSTEGTLMWHIKSTLVNNHAAITKLWRKIHVFKYFKHIS